MTEPITTFERGWIFRIRPPHNCPPSHVYLMIHGWTGDERSMEIFSRGLPEDSLVLFPRAPLPAEGGGYAWSMGRGQTASLFSELQAQVEILLSEVDQRIKEYAVPPCARLRLAGFSQGAAMAYLITLLHPQRVERLAGLSGFLPGVPPDYPLPNLEHLPVYVAHGVRDQTIPVEKARDAVQILSAAGADVEYCENEAAHKLPATCFAQLSKFLSS